MLLKLIENTEKLENLDINSFISTIEQITAFRIQKSTSGLTFSFGFKEDGKFFTFDGSEVYNNYQDFNEKDGLQTFLRAIHVALSKKEKALKSIVGAPSCVEMEITVDRGNDDKVFISFVGPTELKDQANNATVEMISALEEELNGKSIKIKADVLETYDGATLVTTSHSFNFIFEKPEIVPAAINVDSELNKLKTYLEQPNETVEFMTNFEILTANLGKIPVEQRDAVKAEREIVQKVVLSDYELPIKEKLLTSLSELSNTNFIAHDGKNRIKITNPDYESVNDFTHQYREAIRSSIKELEISDEIPVTDNGGYWGQAQIRIANLFGMPELARPASAVAIFKKFDAKSENDVVEGFTSSLTLYSRSYHVKIVAILQNLIETLDQKLDEFKRTINDQSIDTTSGKVKYDDEAKNRTMLLFAETSKDAKDLLEKVKAAKTLNEVIKALYHDAIRKSQIDMSSVKEEIVVESYDRNQLKMKSADDIKGCYTATLLGFLVMLRSGYEPASSLLNDRTNYNLKKFSNSMSPLNYWGFIIFNSKHADIKDHLDPRARAEIWKTGTRFLKDRIKAIHTILSNKNEHKELNWDIQNTNIRVVTLRFENRTAPINKIRAGLLNWDSLTLGQRSTVVKAAFQLLMQYVPNSKTTFIFRNFMNEFYKHSNEEKPGLLKSIVRLVTGTKVTEDEAGPAAPVADAPASTATTQADIAPVEFRFFKGKVMKRRRRTFEKENRFKRPNSKEQQ